MPSDDLASTLTTALSGLHAAVANAKVAAGKVGALTTGSKEVQDTVRPLLKLQKSEQAHLEPRKTVTADDENLGDLIDITA